MSTLDFAARSDFLRTVVERGYVHQCAEARGLDGALSGGVVAGYIGFDCTADSLHVGSLIQIMILRWLQKTGHKPVVLMGGGTTRIGDPSGRDQSRAMLCEQRIEANKRSLRTVFAKYLTFGDGPTDALMVDNAEWLNRLDYIGFLREYGAHFTVNRMLSFDSVKLRLERKQQMSFLEFNYMILQAYDFLELNRRHGVTLQMGGSDQWGNIVNGMELIRRLERKRSFALTSPLLTTASGAKMGKSAAGAVWLNQGRLSTLDFWQFWRNVEDADVGRFLRLYTELPLSEIARLEALEGGDINEAKKILADEVSSLARGKEDAALARETAEETFERGGAGADLPTVGVAAADLAAGVAVIDLLISANMATSRGEARRLVRGGGVRINDVKVVDENRTVCEADLVDGQARLSAGRKRHSLLKRRRHGGGPSAGRGAHDIRNSTCE